MNLQWYTGMMKNAFRENVWLQLLRMQFTENFFLHMSSIRSSSHLLRSISLILADQVHLYCLVHFSAVPIACAYVNQSMTFSNGGYRVEIVVCLTPIDASL